MSHQDVPLVSSLESADSVDEAFVPNDFAEDGSHPVSLDLSRDEGEFDKSLLKFYLNQESFNVFFIEEFIVSFLFKFML